MNPNNLTASELKAIEEHKYYLSQKRKTEVTMEEAIADFVQNFAKDWRNEKLRRDNLEQRKEIEKHKYLRSLEEGRDIGRSSAAEEWCQKYAHIWRAEHESLDRNGFKKVLVTIHSKEGLHLRPVSAVAELAAKFDCDIYVHREGMPYYNFLLEGRPYMNVRSVLGVLSIGAAAGDTLEFIATGSQSADALKALSELLANEGKANNGSAHDS
jgi:phosphocarrier protein HPr